MSGLLMGAAWTPVMAVEIEWGNLPGDVVADTSGMPLDAPDTYTFELGAFQPGFKPTIENTQLWASQWIALDSSEYQVSTGEFGGTVTLGSGNASPFTGSQAFVWAYDERIGSEGTIVEWAIYTLLGSPQSWVYPDPDEPGVPDTLSYPLGDADFFLFGSRAPIDGSDGLRLMAQRVELRTTIVPEPSAAVLLGLAGLAVFGGRRRERR